VFIQIETEPCQGQAVNDDRRDDKEMLCSTSLFGVRSVTCELPHLSRIDLSEGVNTINTV
jgi:hypothetical protein